MSEHRLDEEVPRPALDNYDSVFFFLVKADHSVLSLLLLFFFFFIMAHMTLLR